MFCNSEAIIIEYPSCEQRVCRVLPTDVFSSHLPYLSFHNIETALAYCKNKELVVVETLVFS